MSCGTGFSRDSKKRESRSPTRSGPFTCAATRADLDGFVKSPEPRHGEECSDESHEINELENWIISNLVEKKTGVFLKRIYFQLVLRIEKIPYGQMAPCPGKKAFASPKRR
jgi:hypothetical protein